MKIWEDEKQVYIRASMERNTPEQNAATDAGTYEVIIQPSR